MKRVIFGVALAAACVAVVAVTAPALGFVWDPFDRSARRVAALEARLAVAESASATHAAVAQAERDQSHRLDAAHRRNSQAVRTAADHSLQALEAPDADHPLAADRADRLHRADRRLCSLAPDLCAADARPQRSGAGDLAVSVAGPD